MSSKSHNKPVKSQAPGKKGAARKPAPKQPLPVPDRLKRLFTSLCAQIDGGHFANAVKTCEKILRLEPNDPDALQTKLFLLLQTERYADALTHIDARNDLNQYDFEKAYALYRSHKETDAREILGRLNGEEHRGVVHLEAQLNYREGSYEAAVELYNQLLDTAEPNSEEHSDILTNLQASQKYLDFINSNYLRSLDVLPTSLTSTLETAAPPAPPAQPIASVSKQAPEKAQQPPVKKVRASRVPAGVVPGVTPPPDPERWLKKSERSNYGAGKRRKGAGYGGGGATQGSLEATGPNGGAGGGSGSARNSKGKKRK